MAGEDQYISPIINAFLKRREQDLTNQRATEQNQRLQQQAQNETKYRDALIREAESRIQAQRDIHDQQAELTTQMHNIAADKAQQDMMAKIRDVFQNAGPEAGAGDKAVANFIKGIGGKVNPGFQPVTVGGQDISGSSPTFQTKNPVTGEMTEPISTEGMATGQDVINRLGQQSFSKSEGTSQGALGANLTRDQQKQVAAHQLMIDKTKGDLENKLKEEAAKGADAQTLEKLRGYYQQVVANVHNTGMANVAKINQGLGMDQASAASDANNVHNALWTILDGGDITKLPKPTKMQAFRGAEANNIELPTTKAYGDTLRAISQLPAILPQLQELADKYSIDSPQMQSAVPGLARGRAMVAGSEAGKLTGIGSDISAKQDAIRSIGAQLAAVNDPGARILAGVLNAQASLVNPSNTKAQNQKNINDFKGRVSQAMDNNLFAGIPKEYATAVKAHHGLLDFDESNNPSAVPSNVSPVVTPTAGATPPNKQHPTVPGAIWDPVKSQQLGHDVWQAPTQSSTAVPAQSPQGVQ
jgi:hypothetical protein